MRKVAEQHHPWIAFTKTGERMVGQTAKRQAVTNSENTIYSINGSWGRRFDEVEQERDMVTTRSSVTKR